MWNSDFLGHVFSLLMLGPTLVNNSSNISGGVLRKLKNDFWTPSATLPSTYRNVQTVVFFPEKVKAEPNIIFVVFYVASFVSLTIKCQVVHLEGLVVLEVANYKACIRDSFYKVLMKNYLNSVFFPEYMSVVYKYWEPVENIAYTYQELIEIVLGYYCSLLQRTTNLSKSSTI